MKWGYISFCSLLLLAGCGQQTLYTSLPEKEVNEMVAILLTHGINCEKVSGKEDLWNAVVDKDLFSQAVQLLNDAGYPRDTFSSLGDTFKKSGLVSSPTEERIRFMHALSEELAETLTHIHGVVTARVHIVLPDNDPYTDKITPSSAAVFISYLPQINLEDCAREIRQLVTNSIEGLSYDKVNLSMFQASNPSERIPLSHSIAKPPTKRILGVSVLEASTTSFICLFIGTLLVGILGGVFLGELRQSKQKETEDE